MSFEFKENITLYMPTIEKEIGSLSEAVSTDNKKLIIELAAIHEGLTANYNHYAATELEKSLSSWVQPYPKPIITNHDQESESLGRVMAAKMDKESDGLSYIRLQVAVTGADNVEKCLDERFLTGSVGGKAESAKCSICNTEWADSSSYSVPCKHVRGKVYNGKLAYMELSGITWKEYSFVNVPADQKSGFRKVMLGGSAETAADGDTWVRPVSFYSLDMNKESIVEFCESESPREILTEMKKKEAHVTYMNVKGTFLSVSAYDYEEKNNTNNDEKSTFNKTHTTIDDELRQETLAQDTAEENDNMTRKSQEDKEDILSITEQLSADLASKGNEETSAAEGEESSTEETVEEEATEGEAKEEEVAVESSEDSDVKTETETETTVGEEEKEVSTDAQEEQLVSKEDIESANEQVEEEQESDTKATEASNEELENAKAQVEALQTENARLKKSLHFMLAERVVDAKINLGIVESSERASELTEHSNRTASSLADALRDLEKMPAVASRNTKPELNEKTVNTDASNKYSVTVENSDQKVETVISESQVLEDYMVDVMMNRKKL